MTTGNTFIDALELPTRASNVLASMNIENMDDFMAVKQIDVTKQPQAGYLTWAVIMKAQKRFKALMPVIQPYYAVIYDYWHPAREDWLEEFYEAFSTPEEAIEKFTDAFGVSNEVIYNPRVVQVIAPVPGKWNKDREYV